MGDRFTDLNGDTLRTDKETKKKGFFVSTAVAFVLVLLAVLIAVGVGIIVHFAGSGDVVCKCSVPEPTISPAKLQGLCVEKVKQGDPKICSVCPKPTTVKPTQRPTVRPTKPPTSSMMPSKPATSSTPAMTFTTTPMTTFTTTPMTTPAPKPMINYRLPKSIKPIHYNLELKPDIYGTNSSKFTYEGSVQIQIKVYEATNNITIHKNEIDIDRNSIHLWAQDDNMTAPSVENVTYEVKRHFYVLHLSDYLMENQEYIFNMTFKAKMRTDDEGFYTSSYKEGNRTIYLATTDFEAPDARKAFPCFDEPAMKATFNITLVRRNDTDRNYISISNARKWYSEYRGSGYVADVFHSTPIMSTYILAFIVCDFKYLSNMTGAVEYRTWARPQGIEQARLAQNHGVPIFNWLEAKFDPPYPIDKLDNIAIPDFKAGAMENWGLITYAASSFLYKKGESTTSRFTWIPEVIAHEITHMWFGNLVSPKWWWYLWLNEAFASFWDFYSLNALYPEQRETEQFIVQSSHYAMSADSVRTSHPMTNDAESPKELDTIFDTITYSKGAAVVRMMNFIMGEDLFVKGLNRYFQLHKYSNVEHQDLWNALTDEAYNQSQQINMTKIMDPWVTQMNFPVVHVTRTGPGVIKVTQSRFLASKANTSQDTALYNYMWEIPITFTSNTDMNFTRMYRFEDIQWLEKTEKEANITGDTIPDPSANGSWVIVNIQQYGFFRVNYDDNNWMALIEQLKANHTVIHPLNRAQIINDAFNLARAELLNASIALRTLNYLEKETDYVPWRAFAREVFTINSLLKRTDIYGHFKDFMIQSLKMSYDKYGIVTMPEDLPITIFQRSRIVYYACYFGLRKCLDDASGLFKTWMENSSISLNVDFRERIYCAAIRNGGWKEWEFVRKQYLAVEDDTAERNRLFRSLSCTEEIWLQRKSMAMVFESDSYRKEDRSYIITNVAGSPTGRNTAWNFIKANFAKLRETLEAKSMSRVIRSVASQFYTEYDKQEMDIFAKFQNISGTEKAFASAQKTITSNIETMGNSYGVIKDWLMEMSM